MKNYTLNFLKFIAAILVVCIHCRFPGNIGQYILSIARISVPIFFIISGYYSYNNSNSKIKSKIKNIFSIIVFSNLFYMIYKIICTGSFKIINVKQILLMLIFNDNPFRTHLWFLNALLYCYIILLIVNKNIQKTIFKLYPIIAIIIVIMINIFIPTLVTGKEYYYRNFILIGFTFFIIGFFLKEKEVYKNISTKKLIILAIISLITIVIETKLYYSELYISNVLLAISLFLICQKHPQIISNKYLNYLGEKITLYIYVLHPFIKDIVLWFYQKFNIKSYIFFQPIIVIIISIVMSIVIKYLVEFINTSKKEKAKIN